MLSINWQIFSTVVFIFTSWMGVLSLPIPGRSIAIALCPLVSKIGISLCQFHELCQEPWMRINVFIVLFFVDVKMHRTRGRYNPKIADFSSFSISTVERGICSFGIMNRFLWLLCLITSFSASAQLKSEEIIRLSAENGL